MTPSPLSNGFLLSALCLSLAACGGGSAGNESVPLAQTPAPAPATYTPDLRSFAVAWISLQIAETALDVIHISGETGNCGAGGSTAYDAGAVKQTVSQCITKTSPDDAYNGSWSASVTVAGLSKTVTMSSPSLVIANPVVPTQPQLAVTAGNVTGVDDFSNDTFDAYSNVGFSFDAHIGTSASVYHVASSAGVTASQSYQNGVATSTIANAAVGVNVAGGAWKFTVQGLRSVGDAQPDQGTLVVADQSQPSTASTSVTFGAANALQFASGGQSVAKNWNDADVQAALAAAKL